MSEANHPPTEPGELVVPERPSVWPTVIGIIAIVFGTLGALGGVCGAIGPFIMGSFAAFSPQMEAQIQWIVWTIAISSASLVLGLMLLLGGIMLVGRKRSARTICLLWSILKILYISVETIVNYFIQVDQFEAMRNDPNMPAVFTTMMPLVGVVFGLLWGLALPVFMLIWFSTRKVRREVESWTRSAPGPFDNM